MLVVIALGGNALLRRDQAPEHAAQQENVRIAAAAVAEVAREHKVVVTHGNGPQIGLLALQAAAYRPVKPYPLDVMGAESEGMIGYVLERELANAMPGRATATLLTQVEVDPSDPAFAQPTKPIGPVYDEREAERIGRAEGWTMGRDGPGWRRLVASPAPRAIRELAAIRLLVRESMTVICAGGGGIPVAAGPDGRLAGVEAVIDKDHVAGLLAAELGADRLLLLTDVATVYEDWPQPARRAIRAASPAELRRLALSAGSMAPKVEAACAFAERGGQAAIGALGDAAAILRGAAGTSIVRDAAPMTYW
ncbi:MAG TPA: carbamate kinase [Alphaproteobacteria bacterium]|jgi:carbamate kinase|nr:carbamate kinase [Alphaproteobacteria bacterium]